MSASPKAHVHLKVHYLPFLAALLFLLQLFVPHKSWVIMLIGLGGAWLISHRWAHSLAARLELTREWRYGWIQVGDQLQERFTLTNRGWAPAYWVSVLDHSTLPGYQVSKVRSVGGWTQVHWFTDGVCQRRGLFTLGPTSLETGDPFGFYQVTLTYPGFSTMIVMPPVLNLPAIDVASGGRVGEGRRTARHTLQRSVNAATVRQYTRGDSLNRVHWPTSARRNELFVHVFAHTLASDWWIFLDLYQPVQAGQGMLATEEHGVILAASLAAEGLKKRTAVGLAASGHSAIWLPPKLGQDQRWCILRQLALATPGKQPLARLLASAGASLQKRSSLIIITADGAGEWLDTMLHLMRRGIIPTVLLLDRAAFGGRGEIETTSNRLLDLGVTHYRITPDLLDKQARQPGQIGQWQRTPQGHWEPKFDPLALDWRELT